MTDEMKEAIRSRMGVDLSLNVCEYLKTYHSDTIRRLWEVTERRGREHASAMWLEGGQPATFSPKVGEEESIEVINPPDGHTSSPVNITVHTHPNNTLALSENDFLSLSGKLQFPPSEIEWVGEDTVRGIAIVTRRLKEDEISIRGWTGLPPHTELTIDEQQEIYKQFASDIRSADAIKRGLVAEDSLGELATACIGQVEP